MFSFPQTYREALGEKYELLKQIVTIGNEIINIVTENGPAFRYIDNVVRGTTQRWQELVSCLRTTEEDLSNVLISWQACDSHVIIRAGMKVGKKYLKLHQHKAMKVCRFAVCFYQC